MDKCNSPKFFLLPAPVVCNKGFIACPAGGNETLSVSGWFSFQSGYNIRTIKIHAPQPNASIPISCPFAFFL